VCFLAVFHESLPQAPLVLAANRDERLSRPSTPMTVLRESGPRIVGGRDDLAGGTWLAVSERGLAAGVTNQPGGKVPGRRSRGELPLVLAAGESAERAALDFSLRPDDFSPAWMLAADRDSAWYLDMTAGERAERTRLPPGLHLLENKPLGAASPKLEHARRLLAGVESLQGDALAGRLHRILGDHAGKGVDALCVHAGEYGTRSSSIVIARPGAAPEVWYTEGPPCRSPLRRAELWNIKETA
jgi:uncharacterized protein with NRDE domain